MDRSLGANSLEKFYGQGLGWFAHEETCMKNRCLAFFSFLILFVVPVYAADHVGQITGRIAADPTHAYFFLSDGTFWKAYPFEKRWRTLGEWWSGMDFNIPDAYESKLDEWILGSVVGTFPKYQNLSIDEAYAANKDHLKICTHLFVNQNTGKVLFAAPLVPADYMMQIFEEGSKKGYAEGYKVGHADGYRHGYLHVEIHETTSKPLPEKPQHQDNPPPTESLDRGEPTPQEPS